MAARQKYSRVGLPGLRYGRDELRGASNEQTRTNQKTELVCQVNLSVRK